MNPSTQAQGTKTRKHAGMLGLIAALVLISSCSDAQTLDRKQNILIVYLSRTNNTKAVAEIIQKNVGGRLVGLELKNAYPKDYKATVDRVAKENESGFLPPLNTKIDSMENYDVVLVGFPTWGMQLPPPVKSFLHQYDLGGKTVVPFNTNAGYGVGSGFEMVKKLCPTSKVLDGVEIKGGVERDGVMFVMEGETKQKAEAAIESWLRRIRLMQ